MSTRSLVPLACAAALLLAGCAEYPVYHPVLVAPAEPPAPDRKPEVRDYEVSFAFLGIYDKKPPQGPAIPVVKVGMSLANRSPGPMRLDFAAFEYRDDADRRFRLTSAQQAGNWVREGVVKPGERADFELFFDLAPGYDFGPVLSWRVHWALKKETGAALLLTKFNRVEPRYYYPAYDPFWDPWGPYYYGPPYYAGPPWWSVHYGFGFHYDRHHHHHRHRR